MGGQKHRIQRNILELKVRNEDQARALQSELSRMHEQRIAPLIDRYCTECSEPDRLHRIERLEIELGHVDIDDFERGFLSKLSDRMPAALAEQIRLAERDTDRAGLGPKADSQIEVFGLFARTGSVPWWADLSQPHLLDDALRVLIQDAPGPLARMMGDLARERSSLRRIVRHYDDGMLGDLLGLLFPALRTAPSELLSLMQSTGILAGQPRAQLRNIVWQEVLRASCLEEGKDSEPTALYRTVLTRIAIETGATYVSLVSHLRSSPRQPRTGAQGPLANVVEELYRELPGQTPPPTEEPASRLESHESEGDLVETRRILDRLEQGESPMAGLFALCRSALTRLPARYRSQWMSALRELERDAGQPGASDDQIIRGLSRLMRPAIAHRLLPAPALRRWLTDLQDSGTTGTSTEALDQLTRLIRETTQQGPSPTLGHKEALNLSSSDSEEPAVSFSDSEEPAVSFSDSEEPAVSFSDSEELYVENSGLVILWPFLGRFFEHLDLLDEKRFKDTASVHRAVGLLQYLATEDPSPREYLLPLNKVLCGMEVTEVFDFGLPVSDREGSECRDMLEAVIGHAPVLRDMSVPGLRGTFLLRKGVLGTRDGAWLLRVARESFDVVLDRFPWDVSWVNLPWMKAPLRVEW